MKNGPQTIPKNSPEKVERPKQEKVKKVPAKAAPRPASKKAVSAVDQGNEQTEQDLQLLRMQEMARKRKHLEQQEWGRKLQHKHDHELLAVNKHLDAAKASNEKTEAEHGELVNKMRALIVKMTAVKKQSDERIKQLESELAQENEQRLTADRAAATLDQTNNRLQAEATTTKARQTGDRSTIDQLTESNQKHVSKSAALKRSVTKLEKQLGAEQEQISKAIGDQENRERVAVEKLQQQLEAEKARAVDGMRDSQEKFKLETEKLEVSERNLQCKLDQLGQDSEQTLTAARREASERISQLEEQLAGISAKLESSGAELGTRLAAEREAKESAAHSLAMETEERIQADARSSELERMLKSESELHTKAFNKASRLATDQRLMKSRVDEMKSRLGYERQENSSLTAQVAQLTESERNLRLEAADIQANLALAVRASAEAVASAEELKERLKSSDAKVADQQARLGSEAVRNEELESNLADERAELTTANAKGAEFQSLYKTESEASRTLTGRIGTLETERNDLEVKLATVTAESRTEAAAKRNFEKERHAAVEELNNLREGNIKQNNQHEDFRAQAATRLQECLMEVNRNASEVKAEFSKINTGRRKLQDALATLSNFHQEAETVAQAFQEQWQAENQRLVPLVKNILQDGPIESQEPASERQGETVESGVDSESTGERITAARDGSEPENTVDHEPDFLLKTRELVSKNETMSEEGEEPSWLGKFGRGGKR